MLETPGSLNIQDVLGMQQVVLERLEVHKARETLGVYIAMDGSQETKMETLLQKTRRWADRVWSRQLTHTETWFSLTFCIA
jgi:hypothetical protein